MAMREPPDPYAELGVPRDATPAEIARAFRELLRRHHPDTRGGDDAQLPGDADARLQRIIAAHAALSDVRTREDAAPQASVAAERPQQRMRTARADTIRAGPIRWRASP
jgi:molecular chaperone DnaJ